MDTENHFKPLYVVSPDKKDHVRHLKAMLKDADELYLATDEDREGEAIAWHLLEVLNPKVPVKRMVFHEITPEAIRHAIDNPRELDRRLVDAQECRRILDRLYGYEVSPVLWKKVMPRLSAGRVQSVATRVVVQRERERMAFRTASWWDLQATFRHERADQDQTTFSATLVELAGQRLATGKDFGSDGAITGAKSAADVVLLDEATANSWPGVDRPTRHGPLRRAQAVHPPTRPAVHDLDAAAGGRSQAAHVLGADHVDRAAPVRERLHHLHEDRLHDAVGHRAERGPHADPGEVRRRSTCRTRPAATRTRSRTPRRPTRPSARRVTPSAPPTRWPAS